MRRRIIAVLLSLSVGVAAMPMPVMAEGGSEVVLEAAPVEEAVEEAAPEEAAPVEEAVEAPVEVAPEAPVEEAADEVLIIDEEAPVVAEAEAPAVEEESPAEDGDAVIEETVTGDEEKAELAVAANADASDLVLTVNGTPFYGTDPELGKIATGTATIASGVAVDFNPFISVEPYAPNVTLTDTTKGGLPLQEGSDYTITYVPTDASKFGVDNAAQLIITFGSGTKYGNLGNCIVKYRINKYDITNAKVYYNEKGIYIYNGEEQNPKDLRVTLEFPNKQPIDLVPNVDYDVSFRGGNGKDAGPQQIVITGKGKYTGNVAQSNRVAYTIEPAEVKSNITLKQDLSVAVDDRSGSATLLNLKNKIFQEIMRNVWDTLSKSKVDDRYITFSIFNGDRYVELRNLDDLDLEPGVHKYRISIAGYPNYKGGFVDGEYEITPYSTLETIFKTFKAQLDNLEYNGLDRSSDVKNIIKDGFERYNWLYDYDRQITVEAPEMLKADTYKVTIRGAADGDKWPTEDTYEAEVTIKPRQMASQTSVEEDADFVIEVTQQKYSNGTYSEPAIKIYDTGLAGKLNGQRVELVENTDFTWSWYIDPDNGFRKAFITGIGNYKTTRVVGGEERTVEIVHIFGVNEKVDLNSSIITANVKADKDLHYCGKSIEFVPGDIEVTENINGTQTPVASSNYYIAGYQSKRNGVWGAIVSTAPRAAGEHRVVIAATTGNEHFTGRRNIPYVIAGVPFDSLYAIKEDIPDQEVLAQVSLPIPTIIYKTSPANSLPADKYDYSYYKVKPDGSIDKDNPLTINPGYGARPDLISFPEVGTYRLVVTPGYWTSADMEGISGELTSDFKVVARKLDKKYIQVTCNPNTIVWAGVPVTLDDFNLEVKDIGLPVTNVLVKEKDYTAELSNNDKIGYATLKITGKGNYADSLTYETAVKINPRNFTTNYADGFVTRAIVRDQPYSGGDRIIIDPEDVTVYLEKGTVKRIVDPSEYTVECAPTIPNRGFELDATVTVKIRAKNDGHYRGVYQVPRNIQVVAANIGDNTIFAVEGVQSKVYDGTEQIQDKAKIKLVDTRTGKEVNPDNYTIAGYENNIKVGTAVVILKAVDGSGYTGERRVEFKIGEIGLDKVEVTPTSVKYDGNPKTVESGAITVKVLDNKGVEVPADQYNITYSLDTVNVGTVTVIATAKDESVYAGSISTTFEITKAANTVTASDITVEVGQTAKIAATGDGALSYTSADTTVATVTTDGTVKGVKAGTAVITVTAAGDDNHEAGSATLTVTVKEKANNKVTASGVKKVFKTKKQSFTISASALDNAQLTFKSDSKSITVNATSGKVTVKAGYVGTANITITAAETANYKKATKTVKVTIVPKATTLKSVTSKNGKITAKWAKKNIATCYQLQYATDKNFTKNKGKVWSKSETATSKTIKKTFTKGKTYYVRIRTCTRTDKSELLYSTWSAAKKVTIK